MFYNAPWRFLWGVDGAGMALHGVRFCLDYLGIEMSTLFARLTIGLIAEWRPIVCGPVLLPALRTPLSASSIFAVTLLRWNGTLIWR